VNNPTLFQVQPEVRISPVWRSGTGELLGYIPLLMIPNRSRTGLTSAGSAIKGRKWNDPYPTKKEAQDTYNNLEPAGIGAFVEGIPIDAMDQVFIEREGLYRG